MHNIWWIKAWFLRSERKKIVRNSMEFLNFPWLSGIGKKASRQVISPRCASKHFSSVQRVFCFLKSQLYCLCGITVVLCSWSMANDAQRVSFGCWNLKDQLKPPPTGTQILVTMGTRARSSIGFCRECMCLSSHFNWCLLERLRSTTRPNCDTDHSWNLGLTAKHKTLFPHVDALAWLASTAQG